MYSFRICKWDSVLYICDIVNTTTVVVLFWTIVHDMLIYYKTWIYQCLIKQVKSPNIRSRVLETGTDPPNGSGRETGRDSIRIPMFRDPKK